MTCTAFLVLLHAAAPTPFAEEARIAYLRQALDVLESTPLERLHRARIAIGVLSRGACASSFERLRVDCMLACARRFCRDNDDSPECRLYADVIAANALAEEQLVPISRRYELLVDSPDPRQTIDREVVRLQGELVVALRLATGRCAAGDLGCVAAAVDRFCLASAAERQLAWQACSGALLWFIATAAR